MFFFNQEGKKKKKERTRHTGGDREAEPERSSPEKKEPEKSRFLTPEERHVTKDRDGYRISEEETPSDRSGETAVRGEPMIINGADYLLRVNEARMEVLLTLYRTYSAEELRALLRENGIVHGVREKVLEELAQGRKNYEEILVAAGTAARDGRDGFFEYHFNPRPETRPIILPDGSVDYNVLGKIELVTNGQLLVTYHPALPAVNGRDVLGSTIEAREGKELPPLQCKRCEADESGCNYYAGTEGNVTVEGGCLTVTPIYVVKGNLDAATGDVDFHGDVLIQGNVLSLIHI